ncbi:CPBP family glutamic-type intramembrane protease [Bacillus sp. SA1-12]|uniref:CPBP family glutamic-type intramembrane protease n=1 Tax=Bacillus sp. SA1-12 TaxID=1455638 RepID=UPI0018CC7F4F|nr:CPBP family glutamic-type intramembrane protease [Bacillus sp. SA1-12]
MNFILHLKSKQKRGFILLSPILIITVIHFIISISNSYIQAYSWVLTALLYWTLLGLMIVGFVSITTIKDWFKKPLFKKKWLIIGILIGLFPVAGILIPNYSLIIEYPTIAIFVLFFALINPWFEQGYWRGLLLDAGKNLPAWAIVFYSSFLFSLSHSLLWGIFSIGNRSIQLFIVLFIMGIIWSVIRYKTKSLRWPLFSHVLVDIGNLSVFVFLNLYVPPGM